jgi:RNA polymerase sigma-70 factor (ECF subfamily)
VSDVEEIVADLHRREWAAVLAATVRVARDLDLAEESVQEAYVQALERWPRDGIPDNPAGWLVTAARRRVLDAIRRAEVARAKLPLLLESEMSGGHDRLSLVFTCCHPALAREAQIALTLRLVCGVSTGDIARAFLVSEPTMAARVTRAKKKIAAARIPFRVPAGADLPERLDAVLSVIHLLYTTGHTAPTGEHLRRIDLSEQAVILARMLRELMPDEPEVRGLLALFLVLEARSATRTDAAGRLLRLEEQDRTRWNMALVDEGRALILEGLRPGRYLLQAAIAALHAEAPSYEETDWPQIVTLYDALLVAWPSPVVALNRAVAVSMADGPAAALRDVEALESDARLAGYRYLPAIKADLLRRLGRRDEAVTAYEAALALTENAAERTFLSDRLGTLR